MWVDAVPFLLLVVIACFQSSCEKADFGELDEEESKAEGASLTIKTRVSSDDDGEISYPVNVYVMDSSGKCVDVSQLNAADDQLTFTLAAGTYDVYAVGGADEERYSLPTKDNATKTSIVQLRDGMEYGDLMTSSDNVVLTKGEKNTLTLDFSRRVSKIESVEIEGLSSDVTAVEITLSPLAKYIYLDGSNSEDTYAKTIQLNHSSDGSWTNTSGFYITESTSNVSLKVGVTAAGAKSSYTCNYRGKIEANHKVSIHGVYNDNSVTILGVMTGAKWGDPVTIDFELNPEEAGDNGSSDDNNPNQGNGDAPQHGDAPSVGSLYDNCVVVKSVSSGSSTTVTLMTLDEYNKLSYSSSQKGKDNAKFQAAIASCIEEILAKFGDGSLRLPTIEELQYVFDNRETINGYIENIDVDNPRIELKGGSYYCGYYYLADDGNIYVYALDGSINQEPNPNRVTFKVRGFKTLTFTD